MTRTRTYVSAFVVAGVVLPIILHFASRELMPWWPDTVSMGIAFGATALVIVWKNHKDREARRRFSNALKTIRRRWTSN